jgi:hypothetical protein
VDKDLGLHSQLLGLLGEPPDFRDRQLPGEVHPGKSELHQELELL